MGTTIVLCIIGIMFCVVEGGFVRETSSLLTRASCTLFDNEGRLTTSSPSSERRRRSPYRPIITTSSATIRRYGWLENFFEPPKSPSSSSPSREIQYPEQYPATYELNTDTVDDDGDNNDPSILLVRPLLKNTQLQSRSLQVVYDANKDGWNPTAFHAKVDGNGAAIVVARTATKRGTICGGYNPKGWSSLGGARPSVAAFLFYEKTNKNDSSTSGRQDDNTTNYIEFQKLRKVGGGGLACARDDPDFGISFGPDGLVISLLQGREKLAQSKLGPYFERGPEDLSSIFEGGAAELSELKVLVGKYDVGEEIPYSGGVLDMTSG